MKVEITRHHRLWFKTKSFLQLSLPLNLHQLHLEHEKMNMHAKEMTKINNATNLENEDRVSGDLRRAATGPVAKLRRDDKLSLLSLTHTNL